MLQLVLSWASRSRKRACRRRLLLLTGFLGACWPGDVFADPSAEDVIAACIYKSTRFIDWPEAPGEAFVVAIVGPDPLGGALDAVLKGRSVNDRPVRLVSVRSPRDPLPEAVQLVVLSDAASRRCGLLEEAEARSAVTVALDEGFSSRGGMIELSVVDRRIRFGVNPEAFRRADLDVASAFLALAAQVESGRCGGSK